VGWYLIVPKLGRHATGLYVKTDAPSSEWSVMRSFDKAEACADYRHRLQEEYKAKAVAHPITIQAYSVAIMASQCIARDDPRLKGN
jgi:hypothetical protein